MFSALPPNATCLYYFPYFRPAVFNVMFTEKTLYIAFKTKKIIKLQNLRSLYHLLTVNSSFHKKQTCE